MKLFRCLACKNHFAIVVKLAGKGDAGKPALAANCCPMCKSEKIEEVDMVAEAGAHMAKRILDLWKKLPSE